jgi:phosphoinositide-3-kinase regulatory subunit 4
MIEKNPANRKSAELYLSLARGKIFPEYFYGFLQSYMQIFSAAPILSPDEKISRLKKDIGNITNMLKNQNKTKQQILNNLKLKNNKTIEFTTDTYKKNLEKIKADLKDIPKLDKLDSLINENWNSNMVLKNSKNDLEGINNEEGLIIITQLVTSCIRGLHHSQSKLQSLEILLELADNTYEETILDRILPFIVSILFINY